MAAIDYLEEIVDDQIRYTGRGDEAHFNCLFCGDTRHRMYYNLSSDKAYCHNCNLSGTLISLIMELESCKYEKAYERYKEIKGSHYIPDEVLKEIKTSIFAPDVSHLIEKRPIPLPDEYVKMSLSSKNLVNKRAINYLLRRGITWKQMKEHSMGYCVSGDYADRIIIPIMEGQDLRFWVARAIGNSSRMKEKSPSNEDYQISKSQVIFNIHTAATVFNTAVISEGIFDALSFGDIGVSLLGKTLYEDQLSILLSYKDYLTNGVYIALDYDAADKATQMARQLYQYMPVRLVNIPKKYDDPNNFLRKFGRKELINLVDNAVEYSTSYMIKRKFFVQ